MCPTDLQNKETLFDFIILLHVERQISVLLVDNKEYGSVPESSQIRLVENMKAYVILQFGCVSEA